VHVLAALPDFREPNAARYPVDMLLASSDAAFRRAVELRPNDRTLWVARGRFLAWHQRWPEAARAYVRATDDLPGDEGAWLECAATMLLAGDLDGYDRICEQFRARMNDRSRRTPAFEETWAAYIATRIYGLGPVRRPDPRPGSDWASHALVRLPTDQWNSFYALCEGAAAYERMGNAKLAVQFASMSLDTQPLWGSRELAWYVLALAHEQLGNHADARRWLLRAENRFLHKQRVASEHVTPPLSHYLRDDLEEILLRRKAQARILDPTFPSDPFIRAR
jgi:tetratricopeptide (TPR) repeat protein